MKKHHLITLLLATYFLANTSATAGGPRLESAASQKKLDDLNLQIKQHPDQPKPLCERAQFWFDYDAPSRARADLMQSLKIKPTAYAYFRLGKISISPPENKEAMEWFAKARTLGDNEFETLISLGAEYTVLHAYDKAEEAYGAALKLKTAPPHADVFIHAWRAKCLYNHKKYDQAIADAEIGLRELPKITPLPTLEHSAPLGEKKPQIISAMQMMYTDDARIRALSYVAKHDYKKAIDYLNYALKIAPADISLMEARAETYDKLGKPELAARDRLAKKEHTDFFFENAPFSSPAPK